MSVKFSPDGLLDIATDPSDLPFQIVGKQEVSGAMRRCTNMHLDQKGVARTRLGSAKFNTTPLTGLVTEIIEQAGDRYEFTKGKIYRNEVEIGTGYSPGSWSAMVYNAYNSLIPCVFASNGEDRKRIQTGKVYEWGIDAPNNPLFIGIENDTTKGSGGGVIPGKELYGPLTGDYKAVYTWCRKEGDAVVCESNPCPETNSVTLNNDQLGFSHIPVPGDPQITHARIYRTTAGGVQYYWDQDVPINGLGIGMLPIRSDNLDTYLGAELVWNNNRPPAGSLLFGPTYNGYCFIASGNKFYFSKPHQPESWPLNYYVEVGPPQFPIRSMCIWGGYVWVMTDIEVIQIQGTGSASYFPIPMKCQAGTRGRRALDGVKGGGMYHWGMDGIYAYTGGDDDKISERLLGPIFKGITSGSIPGIDLTKLSNCIIFAFKSKVWLGYPSVGATYPDNFIVFNMAAGDVKTLLSAASPRISHYHYGKEFTLLAKDNTYNRVLAADVDGYIWELDKAGTTDDDGTAIAWEIESKSFSDQLYKYFPRYAKYDVSLDAAQSTAKGEIMLDDSVKQVHQITQSRNTDYRLVRSVTGNNVGVRLTGTGPVTIYSVEIE